MQKSDAILKTEKTMPKGGIMGGFFYTFSSKKANSYISRSFYAQSISSDFTECPFTEKEKDEETGYGYFGARYMDYELMTMWLSVDPMADKYPNISPYAYCAWNPIMAIDPSGMDSVHTPNGMVNVGEGYKATPDGHYLYGDGLQPKRWNPNLEIGGIVGDRGRGGYENCDESELPIIINEGTISPANIAVPMGFLLEQYALDFFSAAGDVILTAASYLWIIPACLLFSSDTRQCTTDNGNDDVQTSAGQKTDRYGNVLGGSGKPRVNTVHHPTQKKAKDAARNQGEGRPVKHPSPKVGEPHYHPTDKKGLKKPNSPHHEY